MKTQHLRHLATILFWLAALIPSHEASAQKYPQGYFRWPLDLAPEIVANLGELRPNHWHMGLDMRTAQKVDQRVYAAAEGYISYVGIRPQSFGRFIIINHPNGLSTLYAHLNDFEPKLEAWVTAWQYEQQSWAVELTISPDQFPVKKGDFISYSGTTGGSQGPHVHFEIRNTQTGECLNPLLFGMPLRDNVKPVIQRLAIYNRAQSIYEATPQTYAVKKTDSGYIIPVKPFVKTSSGKFSFALQAYDQISGSSNQDGIFSAELYVDGQFIIRYEIDSVSYDETRYMNAHIDYPLRYRGGSFYQHLSRLPGDQSKVYKPRPADGVITLNDTLVHEVKIVVADAYGNQSDLSFRIRRDSMEAPYKGYAPKKFIPGNVNLIEQSDFELILNEDAVYDTVNVIYTKKSPTNYHPLTSIHQVNDGTIPSHSSFTVRLKASRKIELSEKDRVLIIQRDQKGSSVKKATISGQWISAAFNEFGTFQAVVDQSPPTINSLGKGDTVNLSAAKRIAFTPSDNYGIRSFSARLNGQWLRFTNDKGRTWIYSFDERVPYGTYQLSVTVEDLAGNILEENWWFKRAAYTPPPPRKKSAARKSSGAKKSTKKSVPVKKKTKKK